MPEWLNKHWDKLLAIFLSTILAGLIGFFSATRIVDEKLSALGERVAILEVAKDDFEQEQIKVSDNATAILNLSNRFDSMKDRVDLSETRVATIKELTELQRRKTVNELEELLEQYGRK